ncbi:RnfH family protein [soil metagenome]
MASVNVIDIEIAYASSNDQAIVALQVPATCCVRDAIIQSGLLAHFPEIDLELNRIGIFSKFVSLDTILQQSDRVEIYRNLLIDPKQARRSRAGIYVRYIRPRRVRIINEQE